MRKSLLILGALLVLVLLGLSFRFADRGKHLVFSEPTSLKEKVELTPEEMEIKETLIEGGRILGYVDFTSDLSALEEVFVDDPRFPLDRAFHNKVKQVFDKVPKDAGWLTWLKARYKIYTKGAEALEAYERDEIGQEELEELAKEGIEPYAKRPYQPDDEDVRSWFDFYDFKIEGEVAECVHRYGMEVVRTYLVKKEEGWFIAYMEHISMAP
jgi:hypothetical protein